MKKSLIILILISLGGCSSPLAGADSKDLKLEAVKDKIIDSKEYTERTCDKYKEEKTATGTAMVCDKWKETEKVEYTYYDKEVTKSLKYKGYDEKKELRGENYEVYDKGNGESVMRYQLGDDKYKKIDNKFYEVKTDKTDKDKYDSQTTTLKDKILSFFGGDALADTTIASSSDKDTTLDSKNPTHNYGGSTYLRMQVTSDTIDRALIFFTLPSGSGTISNVDFYGYNGYADPDSKTISMYEMTTTWDEGTGNNTASEDGATWATYDGTNNWTSSGGDFDGGTLLDSLGPIGRDYGWKDFSLNDLSLDWGDDANLMFKCNDGTVSPSRYFDFRSKEYATVTVRPYIEITYTAGGGGTTPTVNYQSIFDDD